VFEKVCPGEEFLPKAPNPEDIIYDDGESTQPKETGFEPILEASTEAEAAEQLASEATSEEEGVGGKETGATVVGEGENTQGVATVQVVVHDQ